MNKKNIRFFLIGFLLVNFSCINHESVEDKQVDFSSDFEPFEINYAKGFDVDFEEGYSKVITHSFSSNENFRDSIYVVHGPNPNLPENVKVLYTDSLSIVCQSSTHLAYIKELQKVNSVKGLCGMIYVQNEELNATFEKNEVIEVCLADQIQKEALYKISPDLFLIYPFGEAKDERYDEQGIKTFLISEYLEETQLARLEWIKLFGVLLGETQKANTFFNAVESNYAELTSSAKEQEKTFIMNLPFNDNWFMPSVNSVGVNLVEDAGLTYFYRNSIGTENQLHSKESVWNDGTESDYWVIVASRPEGFGLADLIEEEPVYGEFKSVVEKQVIFCNISSVDYFVSGITEPDIILKDLLFATGQIDNHEPKYFFLLE